MKIGYIKTKITIALTAMFRVLWHPMYLAIAITATLIMSGIAVWVLNRSLLRYILFEAPIGIIHKLRIVFEQYTIIFNDYTFMQATGLVLLAVLFGVNMALLVYVIKNKVTESLPKKSGITAFMLAIISSGCAACGASIVAPLIATFGATSYAFIGVVSVWLNWVGSALLIYSIYTLSLLSATIHAKKRLQYAANG